MPRALDHTAQAVRPEMRLTSIVYSTGDVREMAIAISLTDPIANYGLSLMGRVLAEPTMSR